MNSPKEENKKILMYPYNSFQRNLFTVKETGANSDDSVYLLTFLQFTY